MLTKLLVGDAVELKPDSTLRFPPTVAGKDSRRYDTVTGTTNGSKVYVVYENGTYQEAGRRCGCHKTKMCRCHHVYYGAMIIHRKMHPGADQ